MSFGLFHAFLVASDNGNPTLVFDGGIACTNHLSYIFARSPLLIIALVLSVEPISCMLRKDDPAFKKAVDDSIKAMVKSGELAKMYDKWFVQPIPPSNTKVGLPLSDATKNAWNNPNDKPMEEYAMP